MGPKLSSFIVYALDVGHLALAPYLYCDADNGC